MVGFSGPSRMGRRQFMQAAGLGLAALSLNPLDLPASQVTGSGKKRVIMICLCGGASHLDTFDPKPDAPLEIRGDINSISTSIPSIRISEVFPSLAQNMHKGALIRSLVNSHFDHDLRHVVSGMPKTFLQAEGGQPSIGSVLNFKYQSADPTLPVNVAIADRTRHAPWADIAPPGFLGEKHAAYYARSDMNNANPEKLVVMRNLLSELDRFPRDLPDARQIQLARDFNAQAFDLLSNSILREALKLENEDPLIIKEFETDNPHHLQFDGASTDGKKLLLGGRLSVKAGVPYVVINWGRWDSHHNNSMLIRDHGPKFDKSLAALISYLEKHGVLDDTLVVVMGEFGRSPKINPDAGRDHWIHANDVLLIGGGLEGQVIGATDSHGEYVIRDPVEYSQVTALIYRFLGVDPHTTLVMPSGRPITLMDAKPIYGLAI